MKNKKKIGLAGGAAAVLATVIVAISGQDIDVEYSLSKKNEYVTVMKVDVPEKAKVDICELYLNGELVDKTLLPEGELEAIPLVFEDMSRLELKLYKLGECVGSVELEESEANNNA